MTSTEDIEETSLVKKAAIQTLELGDNIMFCVYCQEEVEVPHQCPQEPHLQSALRHSYEAPLAAKHYDPNRIQQGESSRGCYQSYPVMYNETGDWRK